MAGSITKIPNKYAGGLVGTAFGTCHISHCRSSVEIVCASGDHSSGGFIGELGTSSDPDDTYIDNCLFNGILQGLSSYSWGGFIGWVEDEPDAYISNCLFKPAQVTVTSDGNKTFARGSDIHISNCYYTYLMNDAQGATNASGMSKTDLRAALGDGWEIVAEYGNEKVVPIMTPRDLNGEGTTASPYLIATAEDWEDLSINVILGETYSGKHFLMTDDISVTTMVGTYSGWDIYKTFNGSFNGGGHTLTVNYTTDAEFCGPFRYTYGATVKNLITTGTINASNKHAGGLVGRNGTARLTLENVKSSVTINSTYNGSAEHGGLLGYAINADLIGCAFTGSLLGENSTGCGGLLGWKTNTSNSSANITDCLFAPDSVTVGTTDAYTLARNSSGGVINLTHCYYTEPFGTEQGKQAYSITCANNDITLNFAGAATENEVSGITSYANNHGFLYNDGTGSTLIAGNGDNVSLKLTAPAGYFINSATYTPAGGTATEMAFANGGYSFTMPDTNVVISADMIACGTISLNEENDYRKSWDFDDYPTAAGPWTGITPTCWTVAEQYFHGSEIYTNGEDTLPQVYRPIHPENYVTSGNYTLRLKNRGVYAMPAFADSTVSVKDLELSFQLRQPSSIYRLQVGVVESDGTFTSVQEINNSGTEFAEVKVNFSSYAGNGKRIAFRNVLRNSAQYDYSYNFIDNINLAPSAKKSEFVEGGVNDAMDADRYLNNIVVYPNPTTDVVNVQCTMNNVQCSGIEIVDVYGKVVRTVVGANNYSPTQINVSGLAAGMYFVRVATDRGVVTKAFVKRYPPP